MAGKSRTKMNHFSPASQGKSSPLVSFVAKKNGPKCPFANDKISFDLFENSCLWLTGNSGLGKSTLVRYLAGLTKDADLQKSLDISCQKCQWDPSLPPLERCGILFQQTTLLDALTVAGNISVALRQQQKTQEAKKIVMSYDSKTSTTEHCLQIKQLMELVGLDYARDGNKKPTQLSGGMARRASLALQLAQHKHVIVLDEPFAGLDRQAAISVAKELWHLRHRRQQQSKNDSNPVPNTAIVLISHEPEYANIVLHGTTDSNEMKDNKNGGTSLSPTSIPAFHNIEIELRAPTKHGENMNGTSSSLDLKPNLFGISWWDRFVEKIVDYILWSMPLIALTFCACGLAISMLSCDILARIDVKENVMTILEEQVKPMLKMLTGKEDNTMAYFMVKIKVNSMLDSTLPPAKATLYAIGMAHLFWLEIGPLLTALLLCGRIGASYAGQISTLQATQQLSLLRTMGISSLRWTLYPALIAACLAAPILTILGTTIALTLGGIVGGPSTYGICSSWNEYYDHVYKAIFPPIRLQLVPSRMDEEHSVSKWHQMWSVQTTYPNLGTTNGWSSCMDVLIETTTYPPCFLLLKSTTYILIIMVVAQVSTAVRGSKLTTRGVPMVITSSVVVASLLIIVADWGFSKLWLRRH